MASFEGNVMMSEIVCIIHQIFNKDICMHMWQEMLASDLKLNWMTHKYGYRLYVGQWVYLDFILTL